MAVAAKKHRQHGFKQIDIHMRTNILNIRPIEQKLVIVWDETVINIIEIPLIISTSSVLIFRNSIVAIKIWLRIGDARVTQQKYAFMARSKNGFCPVFREYAKIDMMCTLSDIISVVMHLKMFLKLFKKSFFGKNFTLFDSIRSYI